METELTQYNYSEILLKKNDTFQLIKDHNFMFTKLTKLIQSLRNLKTQLNNDYIQNYITINTNASLLIQKIDNFILKKNNKYTTNQIIIHMSGKSFILAFVYNTIMSINSLIVIRLLNKVTNDLKIHDTNNKMENIIYLSLMIVISFFSTYLTIKYDWIVIVWKSEIKTTIQYLLKLKTLKTKQFINKKENEKNQNADIINLMTVDLNMILNIQWGITRGFSSLLTIGVGLYMLELQIGAAIHNGLIILVGLLVYNFCFSVLKQKCNIKMLKSKDERISLSKDLIQGMKSIKYLCWENIFEKKIMEIRKKEYYALTILRVSDGVVGMLWNCINYILLYVFLTEYNSLNHITNIKQGSANIFEIIALSGIFIFPLGIIPQTFNMLYEGWASYKRVLQFLNQKEIDVREIITNLEINYSDVSFVKENINSVHSSMQIDVISIQSVTFKWPVRSIDQETMNNEVQVYQDYQLMIDSLKIQQNKLTFIIGQIGAGKTALLYGIMNEMDNILDNQKSKIEVNGSIALVTQNHWLQNTSIRENITFGKEFNFDWYLECVQACQLEPDLQSFPNNDHKIISANGENLSGGQKQRIAIARAIYSNKDIYLFDDIFSSLDIHVADAIFQKAILGMLLKKHKTVILVTSHYEYLSEPSADIIYIKNGKQINDQQTIDNYIAHQYQRQSENEKSIGSMQSSLLIKKDFKQDEEALILKDQQSFANMEEEDVQEYRNQGKISSKTYTLYISASYYSLFYGSIFFSLSMQASRSLVDFWLKSEISSYPNQIFITMDSWFDNNFNRTFVYLILLNVAINFIRYTGFVLSSSFAAHSIFKKMNQSILYANMKFFDTNSAGRIVNRLSSDIIVTDDELPWYLRIVIDNVAKCFGLSVGVAIYFPWMSGIIIIILILMYQQFILYRPSNREIKRLSSVNDGNLISILGEICRGQQIIRAFKNQEFIKEQYIKKLNDSVDTWVLSTAVFLWMNARVLLLGNLFFVTTIVTCIIIYTFELVQDYTDLSIIMTQSMVFMQSFNQIMIYLCGADQRFISVERIRQYYELNQLEEMDVIPNPNPDQYSENYQKFSVVFKNVFLTYNNDNKILRKNKYALNDFNLCIKNGEKIAICGRTGSGKSSVLNILFRLYEIQQGQIYIKQKEIRSISLNQLRKQMNIIPQFGFLYNSTLKDNLDPGNKLTNQNVQQIILKSGLNIVKHKSVVGEDDQSNNDQIIDVNFEIEESGKNLSNGEKQIINFLRIIMQDKDIICLDEATSNMDPKTNQILQDKLFEYSEGKTLIVITHRLENLHKYDRVVVLDSGQIVEIGHVNKLRKIKNGFFNKLLNQ